MKQNIVLTILFYFSSHLNSFSQTATKLPADHSAHSATICFAGLTRGEISIDDLASDSLHYTDAFLDSMATIKSFHLTITCNGQVLKYLENNSGNKLTGEMKEALTQFHSGCNVVFDGIKFVYKLRDEHGRHPAEDGGRLKLTLK